MLRLTNARTGRQTDRDNGLSVFDVWKKKGRLLEKLHVEAQDARSVAGTFILALTIQLRRYQLLLFKMYYIVHCFYSTDSQRHRYITIQGQDVVEADVPWLRGLTFSAFQSEVSVLSVGGGSILFFFQPNNTRKRIAPLNNTTG